MRGAGTADGPEPAGPGEEIGVTGRGAETAVIEAALARAAGSARAPGGGAAAQGAGTTPVGTSLLLRGDPGMGKTALLAVADAAARRDGLRVLRMTGAEAETGLPFAALHQVLWPLLDEVRETLATLGEEQRNALERALGVRDGAPPEGFLVADAVLVLLGRAAARTPLVLLLDDIHWTDPSSAAVFCHLRRHLARLPLVLIGATRREAAGTAEDGRTPPRCPDGGEAPWDRTVPLAPLREEHAEALLRARHPWLPDRTRERVLRVAGGNPLALRELPAQIRAAAPDHPALLVDPRAAVLPEPFEELPLGPRIGGLYEDRLRELPDTARNLLLVAALGGPAVPSVATLRDLTACGLFGGSWADVRTRVEDSGLAHLDADRDLVVFHHPLVRAGLVHLVAPARRRAAHRLLADLLPAGSTRQILHLAAAAIGTDPRLAALLCTEADRLSAQGGDAEAAGTMARAAALSPDPADRAARLVDAALMATRAGRLRLAVELLGRAESETRPGTPGPAAPYAFTVACTRFLLHADPAPALALLPAAMELLVSPAGQDQRDRLLEPAFLLLTVVTVHTGDERAWAALARHAPAVSPSAALCLRAWTDGLAETAGPPEPVPHGAPLPAPDLLPPALREAVADLPGDRETAAAWTLLWTAAAVDAVGAYEAVAKPFVRHYAFSTHAFIDGLRSHEDFLHGRWEASLEASRQGAEAAAEYGYAFHTLQFRLNEAQILAARGDATGLAALEVGLGNSAGALGTGAVDERLRGLRVLCALAHGRADEAWHQARLLARPGAASRRTLWSHLSLVDRVQAAVDSGHRAEARRYLRAARTAGNSRGPAHHAFLLALAEALVSDDHETRQRFEAVYARPGAEQWPFPLARAHLAHAGRLRQQGAYGPAADHCRAALTAFTRLGAEPWAARAARELEAAEAAEAARRARPDHPAPDRLAPAGAALSAQELRIAELAAQGLTNRRIGELLGLSPRTIGAHLYKVFPKLGVTTRAALARALDERSAPGTRGRAAQPVPERADGALGSVLPQRAGESRP
ncbi:AAA family ATPase [Streptomyces sp. NPDC004111]|uniref:AAA family ATPase n=1 Tax=Streptomyces sp. NPDC004111 TaxID=3364690 RepID=UPI0036A85027